ncbi:MAG: hypothetical protein RLY50_1411, partial [Actinomycetota bacterium]
DAVSSLGPGLIHVEGGPTLNAALLEADLVDAINLTVSPVFTGAQGPSWAESPHPTRHFELDTVASSDGFVFARWVRVRNA